MSHDRPPRSSAWAVVVVLSLIFAAGWWNDARILRDELTATQTEHRAEMAQARTDMNTARDDIKQCRADLADANKEVTTP